MDPLNIFGLPANMIIDLLHQSAFPTGKYDHGSPEHHPDRGVDVDQADGGQRRPDDVEKPRDEKDGGDKAGHGRWFGRIRRRRFDLNRGK